MYLFVFKAKYGFKDTIHKNNKNYMNTYNFICQLLIPHNTNQFYTLTNSILFFYITLNTLNSILVLTKIN